MKNSYTMSEHRDRFAGWCAASAAAASSKCRFSVWQGVQLIEKTGLKDAALSWDSLPNADNFDATHRKWRNDLVQAAPSIIGTGQGRTFTHGVAAKLINCYLKPIFGLATPDLISAAHQKKFNAIHPPIDRLLLTVLIRKDVGAKKNVWSNAQKIGWSAFSSNDYETVIDAIKKSVSDGLWKIEEHWDGHQ